MIAMPIRPPAVPSIAPKASRFFAITDGRPDQRANNPSQDENCRSDAHFFAQPRTSSATSAEDELSFQFIFYKSSVAGSGRSAWLGLLVCARDLSARALPIYLRHTFFDQIAFSLPVLQR